MVAQPLLTGHFRVFISTFYNSAVSFRALRTGCRIAASIRAGHRPSDVEHRVGSLPQRPWRPPIPSFRLPGTRVQHGALCCQQDTSHRKHTFPSDVSMQTMDICLFFQILYTSRSTTRGDGTPKVPVPYAALQVRAAHICQKLQPWKGLQIPAGISTWLARNKGGASDLNVRRGGTGLTPGLTSRTGNFFLGATKQGAGKGNHHETPFPAVSPNPGPTQHDHFIIRPCSILFLSESLVFVALILAA